MAQTSIHEAHFRVTIPLFSAGAFPQDVAELRTPSIKGALRFWWRALAWRRFGSLEAVRAEERQIFGGAGHGQSKFLLRVTSDVPEYVSGGQCLAEQPGEGAIYLGFGLWDVAQRGNHRRGQGPTVTRPCFAAPFEFTVTMLIRPGALDEAQIASLHDALRLLGTVGGLKARARRGFGSLTLQRLSVDGATVWEAPRDAEGLATALTELMPEGADDRSARPPYTALSGATRAVLLPGRSGESALHLLDRVGREMIFYRSWGRRSSILGERPEKNFRDDHHLMRHAAKGRRVQDHPERIVFGLPQPYYFSSLRSGTEVRPVIHDRRASPLFVHVHQVEGAAPVAVVALLPAEFLPENEKIHVGRSSRVDVADDEALWRPAHEFLDRLAAPDHGKETFEGARELTLSQEKQVS